MKATHIIMMISSLVLVLCAVIQAKLVADCRTATIGNSTEISKNISDSKALLGETKNGYENMVETLNTFTNAMDKNTRVLFDRTYAFKSWGGYHKRVNMDYQEAVKLIECGKVYSIGQSHNLHVSMTTVDGLEIAAVEPEIDAVIKTARKVDPYGLFIGIVTE